MPVSPKDLFNTVIDECESTNDLARTLAQANCPHGTWISARRQTRGRGRSGNVWAQASGNLFFSIVLREVSPAHLTWIPLMVAVATIDALHETVNAPATSKQIRIKWPNDLYIGDQKLGGILCESFLSPPTIIAGIGINVASVPAEFSENSIALFQDNSIIAASFLESLRLILAKKIIVWSKVLNDSGSVLIVKKYEQIAYFRPGDSIQWDQSCRGTVLGLGSLGEMRISTEAGERSLFSEVIFRVRKS